MAQTLVKIDYTGLDCRGIYYVSNDFEGVDIDNNNAPKGTLHKFVIRQTVTVEGIGKKTAKSTYTKSGITFYKALQAVIAEREPMRDAVRAKLLGVSDGEAEQIALERLTVTELFEDFKNYKVTLPKNNTLEKHWSGAYAQQISSVYKTLLKDDIGEMRAINVKKKHIEDCMTTATLKGRKPRSYHALRGLTKQMFEWWISREEMDKRNPASDIKLSKLQNARADKVALSWNELQKLYTAMYSYPDERYRQLWIWLSTGRRLSEVLKLERSHVDSEGYYTIIADNNKARKKMIYKVPMGVTIPLKGKWVHTSTHKKDKHLQVNNADHHWHNVVQNAEIKDAEIKDKLLTSTDIHKHDLRIFIATALKGDGVPLELRSMVLGHTGTTITDRYSTDTKEGADLKHKAVGFFLAKVFNKIDRKMLFSEYNQGILKNISV